MNKIKTGVVGYGFSGKIFQCPFIEAHEDFELAAIVQRHGNEAKTDYPNITLYRDYNTMLEDKNIELIIISTPAHLHFQHAMMALNANKNVVIEKPFATTEVKAQELVDKAKEKNKIIVAYQNRRFDGDFLTIQKLIKDGVKIYEYEAVWDRFVPLIDNNDWHEKGYDGSDLLFDLGTHYLDQALTLFGDPKAIHGTVKTLRPSSKVIDFFSIELLYENKVVRLKSCLHAAKSDIRYKIHTNKGTYHFYEMGEQEHQLLAGILPTDATYGDNAIYDLYDYEGNKSSHQVIKGNYLMYFTLLAKAIRTGSQPPVTTNDSIKLIRYLEQLSKGN